jgi:hypothetical protein
MAIYPVVRGGPQAVSEDKVIAKIVSDTEGMENTPIHVCAKTACFVDLQQKVGELVLSIISCPSIIISENTLNLCKEKMWLW